jgi:hypothetical protein
MVTPEENADDINLDSEVSDEEEANSQDMQFINDDGDYDDDELRRPNKRYRSPVFDQLDVGSGIETSNGDLELEDDDEYETDSSTEDDGDEVYRIFKEISACYNEYYANYAGQRDEVAVAAMRPRVIDVADRVTKFLIPEQGEQMENRFVAKMYRVFGFGEGRGFQDFRNVDVDAIVRRYVAQMYLLKVLMQHFRVEDPVLMNLVNTCIVEFHIIGDSFRALSASTKVLRNAHMLNDEAMDIIIAQYVIQPQTGAETLENALKVPPMEHITKYVYKKAFDEAFARVGDMLYKQKMIDNNMQKTYAWQYTGSTVEDFIRNICTMENPVGFRLAMKNAQSIKNVAEFITKAKSGVAQLPVLERDRTVFSFRNGVYFADRDTFISYSDPRGVHYPMNHKMGGKSPVAARFFDLEFDPHPDFVGENIWKIPTPHVDKILSDQGYGVPGEDTEDADVQTYCVTWALLGRFLYWMRHKHVFDDGMTVRENWQVTFCCYGLRKTGKTKIIEGIPGSFYEKSDIGILQDQQREVHGLEGMDKKFIVIAPDITDSFWLSRGVFQAMSDGSAVQVTEMWKAQKVVENWNIPLGLAFNVNPWADPNDSVGRRQAILKFAKQVSEAEIDPNLDDKMAANMHNIILKANRYYRHYVRLYGTKQFWHFCGPKYRQARVVMASNANPWENFVKSEKVELGDPSSHYVVMSNLQAAYKKYVRQAMSNEHVKHLNTSEDAYITTFSKNGVEVRVLQQNEVLYYPSEQRREAHGEGRQQQVIRPGTTVAFGIDLNPDYTSQ